MNPTTRARDAYLAYQAEIGTEEAVLAAPWVRRASSPASAAASSANRAPAAPPGSREAAGYADDAPRVPFQDAPGAAGPTAAGLPPSLPEVRFEPMKPFAAPGMVGAGAGPEFFSAIAEQLAQADRAAGKPKAGPASPRPQNPLSPAASALSPLQQSLAGLKDLEAYQAFLDAEYPRWFAGTKGVAKASGHAAPRLAVVELTPSPEGVFTGDGGALLDRMMNAIGVTRDQLYLTSLMKSAPASRTWARRDTARMVPVLLRELQLAQCGLVLVMGEACAQALLKTGRSIPDLLKSPVETDGLSLSATWHPDEIRAGDAEAVKQAEKRAGATEAKAARPRATQAWEHLQWLRGLLPAR